MRGTGKAEVWEWLRGCKRRERERKMGGKVAKKQTCDLSHKVLELKSQDAAT